jgi:hypothetical protein
VIREVGTQVQLNNTARDLSGAAVNTPALSLTVQKPDGTQTSPVVTNTGSAGLYTAQVATDQAGLWLYRWTASGTVVDVQSDQFSVVSSLRALVGSMEEFKQQINRTGVSDIGDDAELRTYLVSATDWVERTIGGPLSVQTFVEPVPVTGWWVTPIYRPLVSVISLVSELGPTLDPTAYVVDTVRNGVRIRWGAFTGWYTLTYKAGLTVVPERFKLAGMITAQHLWKTQRGGTRRSGAGPDEVMTGLGFAVPRRAADLLVRDNIPGIA